MANNWTLNERGNIVFPVPNTVKIPWDKSRGDLPLTSEYFNGTMYEKVAGSVLIESSENVEHGGFAAARRSEYGNKLTLPEGKVDASQGVNSLRTGLVFFCYSFKLEHWTYFSMLY